MSGLARDGAADFLQLRERHGGLDRVEQFGTRERLADGRDDGLVGDLRLLQRVVQLGLEGRAEGAHFIGRDVAELDQVAEENIADRRMVLDGRVHQRLGEARLVALVVAVAAVAVHVDHDIALELLANSNASWMVVTAAIGIVAVDVENRRAEHLRDRGAILARTRHRPARW